MGLDLPHLRRPPLPNQLRTSIVQIEFQRPVAGDYAAARSAGQLRREIDAGAGTSPRPGTATPTATGPNTSAILLGALGALADLGLTIAGLQYFVKRTAFGQGPKPSQRVCHSGGEGWV